jgi:hypothetical protein
MGPVLLLDVGIIVLPAGTRPDQEELLPLAVLIQNIVDELTSIV